MTATTHPDRGASASKSGFDRPSSLDVWVYLSEFRARYDDDPQPLDFFVGGTVGSMILVSRTPLYLGVVSSQPLRNHPLNLHSTHSRVKDSTLSTSVSVNSQKQSRPCCLECPRPGSELQRRNPPASRFLHLPPCSSSHIIPSLRQITHSSYASFNPRLLIAITRPRKKNINNTTISHPPPPPFFFSVTLQSLRLNKDLHSFFKHITDHFILVSTPDPSHRNRIVGATSHRLTQ